MPSKARLSSADLFSPVPSGPPGFTYQADVISENDELSYVRQFEKLPLKPFEFHGYLGNRRIVSYGYRYDYAGRILRDADPLPSFLLPLRDIGASFSNVHRDKIQQALITEYSPGAGIGWHRDKPMFEDVIAFSFLSPCNLRQHGQGSQ